MSNMGVPQGFILGPHLFPIYINDLHLAIKYSKVHHFSDDTNLLNFNSLVKSINKQFNHGLKTLLNQPQANKISFNVGKTEFVLFVSTKKQLDSDFKIKLNGKRPMNQIQSNIWESKLTEAWHGNNINHVAVKLNKVNAILSELKHVLNKKLYLTSVYYNACW